ncbi:MAG: type pilus assembly protein PilE [Burkholderiales bacterium]|jgi:type IV pilus assembly protein PilE
MHTTLSRSLCAGFTLIELMVVVAVIAILAGVGVPSYRDYVTRANIAEAPVELSMMAVRLEQFYQDNRRYGTNGVCGVSAPENKKFSYACATSLDGHSFFLTASGIARQGTGGFTYRLNNLDNRSTTAPAGWESSDSCWITKKGAPC